MSGQEVNSEKTSIIFSNNVPRVMRIKLAHTSNFKVTKQLGKYLGVFISGKALKRRDYQHVMDHIASKLAMWKAIHLSFASGVTLSKSIMEVILIFTMMSNMLPKACIK